MDETPLNSDMPSNSKVNKIGEKSIFIKTTWHEKTHFTVVLVYGTWDKTFSHGYH